MIKRTCAICVVFILIVGMLCNISYATDIKTKLDIVKQSAETKYLDNNQGYISKSIVDSDPEKGESTIELKLSNTSAETIVNTDTEIFLVVDNSGSMGYTTVTGEIRRNVLVKSVKTLVNKIYDNSNNVKVGLVRFANSSTLMCNLTDNKQTMLNAIEEYETLDTSVVIDGVEMEHCESGTNIEAGLKSATDNFSNDSGNKVIILLTDGIPTKSIINYSTQSYINNATKDRIKKIGDSGVSIISMMTGITDEDNKDAETTIQQIFGTQQNPTSGKFYNISDSDIQKIVTEDIYIDVMQKVQNPINNAKMVDYFPEEITEYFDITINKPSLGTVSDSINTKDNTIVWDIGTLKSNEVATLQYTLKIKDMQNKELLNKEISTNEKVVLTYTTDISKDDYTVTLLSSPKIKLSEVKQDDNSNNNKNNEGDNKNNQNNSDITTSNKKIPQTGESMILIASIAVVAVVIISILRKLKNMKEIK